VMQSTTRLAMVSVALVWTSACAHSGPVAASAGGPDGVIRRRPPFTLRCGVSSGSKATARLTVVDDRGTPLPGVSVTFFVRQGLYGGGRSEPDGRREIHLEPKHGPLEALLEHAGFATVRVVEIPTRSGCVSDLRVAMPVVDNCSYLQDKGRVIGAVCE
jgi:hypothetical protein